MDIRTYYGKVRDAEATLTGEHFVMVSLATSEGGKAGVRTKVRAHRGEVDRRNTCADSQRRRSEGVPRDKSRGAGSI